MEPSILIPSDTDVRLVDDEVVIAHGWGGALLEAMRILHFALYEDQAGVYWFGSRHEGLPHQDRWLYAIEKSELEDAGSWVEAETWVVLGCAKMGTITQLADDYEVISALQDAAARFKQALAILGELSAQEEARLAANFLMGVHAFDYTEPEEIDPVLRAHWDQDLHDLLRHYDRWAARQPEALPREVALRMYGLGVYADALAEGQDWLI